MKTHHLLAAILLTKLPPSTLAAQQPPPQTQGWPLLHEIPLADGEDEPVNGMRPRYFSFSDKSFAYWPVDEDHSTAAKIDRFLQGDSIEPTSESISPPVGVTWDLSKVWCSADYDWIFWRTLHHGKPFLHAASTSALTHSLELPAQPADAQIDSEDISPGIAVIDNRIYFLGGLEIPPPLQPTFHPDTGLLPHEAFWRNIAWPQHAILIEHIRERILHSIDQQPIDQDSRKAAAQVRELLAKKTMPISGDDIEGSWKVRSIQGSTHGHYAYPFFNARIENLDGIFFFEKTTGSQRRSGTLHRHLPQAMLFLGGRTVNDDPQIGYSSVSPETAPMDSDSIGLLHQLAPDHLIMLLDVNNEGDYEIYELRKR